MKSAVARLQNGEWVYSPQGREGLEGGEGFEFLKQRATRAISVLVKNGASLADLSDFSVFKEQPDLALALSALSPNCPLAASQASRLEDSDVKGALLSRRVLAARVKPKAKPKAVAPGAPEWRD